MIDNYLEQLVSLLPPPKNPSVPDSFSGRLNNHPLPEDYCAFFRTYGIGAIYDDHAGEISLFSISDDTMVDHELRNAGQGFGGTIDSFGDWHELNPEIFPKPYPRISGFLPWGVHDSGYFLGWHAESYEPTNWKIAVPIEFEYLIFDESFTEYLYKLLTPGNKDHPSNLYADRLEHVRYWSPNNS